jgi:hypothetical protein
VWRPNNLLATCKSTVAIKELVLSLCFVPFIDDEEKAM